MPTSINQFIALANHAWIWKTLLAAGLIITAFKILCWLFGGLGFYNVGRIGGYRPLFLAWLPFGQVWFEIRILHHPRTAKRVAPYLWWEAACGVAAFTALVWAVNMYLGGANSATVKILFGTAAAAALASLYCCVRMRILEFRILREFFDDPFIWAFFLVMTIIGIPLQKFYFYYHQDSIN